MYAVFNSVVELLRMQARNRTAYLLGGLVLILVALGAYGWMVYSKLHDDYVKLIARQEATESELSSTTARLLALSAELTDTAKELSVSETMNKRLSDRLADEMTKNEAFKGQIEDITGTVDELDKLSKIDPELLQKYSKVFFLNEHYMPEKLIEIKKEYLYDESVPKFINAKTVSFFEDMLEDALSDDINIWVTSAYRSFDEQASLKGKYEVTYGSGANTFSADQGYSEHQLGTTFDFTTNGQGGGLEGFENTPAYTWLLENAHKYGFVLSYPNDNTYYVFEPWHWRFVGRELAGDLHADGKHFYDLDQRDIDEYLISLFD